MVIQFNVGVVDNDTNIPDTDNKINDINAVLFLLAFNIVCIVLYRK